MWLKVGGWALLTTMVAAVGAAGRQCQCDSPPGGGFACEDNQMSCCYIKDGACTGWCASLVTTPSPGSENDDFAAEIFKEALRRPFSTAELTGGELPGLALRHRDDGQFEVVDRDVHVNVRLPAGLEEKGRAVLAAAAQRLSDRRVTLAVQQAIGGLPTSEPIKVEANAGVVVLTGSVEDRSTKAAAEERARQTYGVTEVHNEIEEKHPNALLDGPPPP